MTERNEVEERAAELVVQALEEDRLGRGGADPDGIDEEIRDPELAAEVRRHVELLGLLPAALEERPPRPELKARVMAAVRRVGSDRDRERDRPAEVASLAAARWQRFRRLAAPRWYGALAASLVLTVIGLALFSGWLYTRVNQQQATIARLSDQLEVAATRTTTLAQARSGLEQEQGHLVNRLALVSTPGTEVCPLRPADPDSPFPDARGLLFLSGPRDEWYVRVANVEPLVEGRVYRLWFLLGDEMRAVGILRPGDGDAVELAGTGLPPADRMTAALVTLEPTDSSPARPTGPRILYGDERMEMI